VSLAEDNSLSVAMQPALHVPDRRGVFDGV
jgi:hypothetical protein